MVDRDARRRYLQLLAAGLGTAVAGCSSVSDPGTGGGGTTPTERATGTPTETDPVKIDDWQYDPDEHSDSTAGGSGGNVQTTANTPMQSSGSGGGNVGLATGGAKDIATFRRNVAEGYLPQPESLAYEGLFYNYYFESDDPGDCSSLFCPTYAPAVTADPLSGETERYLTVGLNSGLAESEFERKRLNLVVVLDISGSMGSAFSDYYYDRFGNRHEPEGDTDTEKIEVARQALVDLTEQLRPDDRLGVVLYNSDASLAKPLRDVERTDMDAIRDHIREDIAAGGGTNLDAGLSTATDQLTEYSDADQSTTENRLIVLTDAMPNLGETDDEGLSGRLADRAEDDNIHTTFVGVGVDFNTELVDELTSVRGANYYGVHSTEEFTERLSDGFEYMVSPLVFDLSLELDAEGYDIQKVYGSTAAEEATGEIMSVNTLFASPTDDRGARGGVVLVQVEQTADAPSMELRASWEDRQGTEQETTTTLSFPAESPESFATTGVRKAVLLSRYADLLKNWLVAEQEPSLAPAEADGIEVPPEDPPLGEWEQQSEPLTVSEPYPARIRAFREHFRSEADAIGDDALDRESELLTTLLETAAPSSSDSGTESGT